jgi:hypothetical protein
MGDIQTLSKPSNIPPVTLEELNDERSKDQWINNHKNERNKKFANDFNPDHIYQLSTNLQGLKTEEMIGYIIPYNRNWVFLPFYTRDKVLGVPLNVWKNYTTNFELDNRMKYMFIYDLGINERAEREAGRSREDAARERRRAEEDAARDSRMVQKEIQRSLQLMEQMDKQREAEERSREEKRQQAASRLRAAEKEGEGKGVEGVQLKDFPKQSDIGGRRTRRRRSTRRKLKQSRKSIRKLKNKKSKKSRK